MRAFIVPNPQHSPAPEGVRVLCRIVRDKSGEGTYYLKLERQVRGGVVKTDLLAARKRKKSGSSHYVIATRAENLGDDDHAVGHLRANFVGTHFSIYDNGISPGKADKLEDGVSPDKPLREELAAIQYVSWGESRELLSQIHAESPVQLLRTTAGGQCAGL